MFYPTQGDVNKMIHETVNLELSNCLICWDNQHVYKMQQFPLFVFSCSCNGIFHSSCLFKWLYTTQSCPICRRYATFNNRFLSWFHGKTVSTNIRQDVGIFARFHTERVDYSNFIVLCLFYILSFFIKALLIYCLCFMSIFSILILYGK